MMQILPAGNALLSGKQSRASSRRQGLGDLACLSDELLSYIFSSLDAVTLAKSMSVSPWYAAWCCQDRLWKDLLLAKTHGKLAAWHGTWRRTYSLLHGRPNNVSTLAQNHRIYSDILYSSRMCSSFDPSSLHVSENVQRIDARTLSTCADLPTEPVILTHAMENWNAAKDKTRWTLTELAQRCPSASFRAEAVLAPLSVYLDYCRNCPEEDTPIYLFDADFVQKGHQDGASLDRDFSVPAVFDQDLFAVMGEKRPEYRWLIAGPRLSGSTFHKDPNRTSAWNAVCSGSKLWLALPPDLKPPGVLVSADEGEVSTPDSVAAWMIHYYQAIKVQYGPTAKDVKCRNKLVQGICRTGEVFHVPSGWWHLVINLEESVALTQNYVSLRELPAVLDFMRTRPSHVSGFRLDDKDDTQETTAGVYEAFCAALQKHKPDLLIEALKTNAREELQPTLWQGLTESNDSMSASRSLIAPAFAAAIGVVSGIWVFEPLIRSSLKPDKPPIMESAVREYEYTKTSTPDPSQAATLKPEVKAFIDKEDAKFSKQI